MGEADKSVQVKTWRFTAKSFDQSTGRKNPKRVQPTRTRTREKDERYRVHREGNERHDQAGC